MNAPQTARSPRNAGFALFELVVAITLMGFLSVFAYSALTYGAQIVRALRTGMAVTPQVELLAERVRMLVHATDEADLETDVFAAFTVKNGTLLMRGEPILEGVSSWKLELVPSGFGGRDVVRATLVLSDAVEGADATTTFDVRPGY